MRIGDGPLIDYPIVDADAHVNEPPNLWQERVPVRLRERAPKVVKREDGADVWLFEEGKRVRYVGLSAIAGLSYVEYRSHGLRYDQIRPSSFDPHARIVDMDIDGIYAQVLYPSVTLAGAESYGTDPVLQVACVRAYNEWLADFCAAYPDRLYGLGVIPTVGITEAVAELEHCLNLNHRGVILSRYPNGGFDPLDSDDPFWARVVEADVPVQIHVGSFRPGPTVIPFTGTRFMGQVAASKSGTQVISVVLDIIFSGLLDRWPGLKIVMVEGNIGWIPTTLEQTDDLFLRYRFWSGGEKMKLLPSEYFYRNIYNTFLVDQFGVANRERCGIDRIMWSTDFPHSTGDWPNSRVVLERNFRGVPYGDVKLMICTNAAQLYRVALPGPGDGATPVQIASAARA